jgi:hypothetical protein
MSYWMQWAALPSKSFSSHGEETVLKFGTRSVKHSFLDSLDIHQFRSNYPPKNSQKSATFDVAPGDVHSCDCLMTQMTFDASGKGMTLALLMY